MTCLHRQQQDFVLPLRAGGPRSGGGVAKQDIKPATLSPTASVLPLKGKTKEKGFVVRRLKEETKEKKFCCAYSRAM